MNREELDGELGQAGAADIVRALSSRPDGVPDEYLAGSNTTLDAEQADFGAGRFPSFLSKLASEATSA